MRDQRKNQAKQVHSLWLLPVLVCIGLGSYWLAKSTVPRDAPGPSAAKPTALERMSAERESPKRLENLASAPAQPAGPGQASGPYSNQRAVTFTDAESMRLFLAGLGENVRVLGRLDALDTLLVGFDDIGALNDLLDGSEETSKIFPVEIPSIENAGAQPGAVALGNGLLEWLGIEGDNSSFGKGIKIAVLDTGIADHPAFPDAIQRINLVPLALDGSAPNGHGTAVASLIFSNNPLIPGVAPGATALSIRIADDQGSSNSFLIAQGIIAAADAGAQIINISLGGYGSSSLVDKAVNYADAKGAVIIAAAGNTGTEGVMQPAAHPKVIAVGAVDAFNQSMAFSTTGKEVALSAPGYGINAAYPGDAGASVSGTSFSGPIAAGVIAATTSHYRDRNISTRQAANMVLNHLKDVGTLGKDSATGAGVPDMGYLLNANLPGYQDASINSIYPMENQQLGVLVQNLGTETLINAQVTVSVNGVTTRANIATLPPGLTRLIGVPSGGFADLEIRSRVTLSPTQNDQRASNDTLDIRFSPPE